MKYAGMDPGFYMSLFASAHHEGNTEEDIINNFLTATSSLNETTNHLGNKSLGNSVVMGGGGRCYSARPYPFPVRYLKTT